MPVTPTSQSGPAQSSVIGVPGRVFALGALALTYVFIPVGKALVVVNVQPNSATDTALMNGNIVANANYAAGAFRGPLVYRGGQRVLFQGGTATAYFSGYWVD